MSYSPLYGRSLGPVLALVATALTAACSGGSTDGTGGSGKNTGGSGTGARAGTGAKGGAGGDTGAGASAGDDGIGGSLFTAGGSTGAAGGDGTGDAGVCAGLAVASEQVVQAGKLDIYLIFDRTASMGQDCAFTPGTTPPVASKACFATYAISQYFMSANAADDTHLAFQFMSLATDDCNGTPYATPLVDMTPLPVPATHPLISAISNETFKGGLGTHIEGALRGLSSYTTTHDQAVGPARTTIGVLMTDGDPNGCDENIDNLAKIVADHTAATGGKVKMFFIGETGATLASLEKYAVNGGAAPHTDFCGGGPSPCHYWNVGDGQPDAFASAFASIIGQATVSKPLPCTFELPPPPTGQKLDPAKVNVKFTTSNKDTIDIFKVEKDACDAAVGGWYYNDSTPPTEVLLCKSTCDTVSAATGANMTVEFGCDSHAPPIR